MELSIGSKTVITAIEMGYFVDDTGVVHFKERQRTLCVKRVGKCEYYYFTINIAGARKKVMVHKMQAYQSFGLDAFKPGIQVRHLNSNSLDNTKTNIAIGSPSENQMDIAIEARSLRSKKAYANRKLRPRRLTDEQALAVTVDRAAGMTYKHLTAKYGVSKSFLSYMLNDSLYLKDITN